MKLASHPLAAPLVSTALVLAVGVAVAVVALERRDKPSEAPAAAAESDRTSPAAQAPPPEPRGAAPDEAVAGVCSAESAVSAPAGAPLPAGARLFRFVNGTFARADDRPALRRTVAQVAEVTPSAVTCFDAEEPAAVAREATGDAPVARGSAPPADRPDAPDVPTDLPGFGTCYLEYTPEGVALPPEATLTVAVSGEYRRRGHEQAVRRAVSAVSGRPPEAIDCSFFVPPVGSCYAELTPSPDAPVPAGATATGSVSGDYVTRDQVPALRAALAAMAGVEPDDILCEDYPDEPVARPLPAEPGAVGAEPGP
jgi:hypothetical protein